MDAPASSLMKPILGKYYVKGMAPTDLDTVAYIEKTSTETFWTKEDFQRILQEPGMQGRVIQGCDQYAGETIGYYLFQLLDDEIQLWNLTIYPDFRRKKIGLNVINNLIRDYACAHLTCYVRDSNLTAQKCLQQGGLRALNVKKGHFVDYDVNGTASYTDAYYFVSL